MNYRSDGSGWRPEGFTHVFVISDEGGAARQLTDGDYQHGAPEWAADSRSVVFSAVRKSDAEYLRGDSEIYAVALSGGAIRQLTDRKGPDNNPRVSNDGKLIAYTGSDQNENTYNVARLYVMSADGTNRRPLTTNFDRTPSNVFWDEDNSGLYFTAEDRGSQNLWFVPVAGGAPRQVTNERQILNITSVARMPRTGGVALVGTRSTSQSPADVYAFASVRDKDVRGYRLNVTGGKQLTDVNRDLLEGRKLGEVEEIWYDSVGLGGNGVCTSTDASPAEPKPADCAKTRVQGWLVKPPDFNPSKKYPLLLYIHGGPHSMYNVGFNFEFQNHAAEGYVVLYTNPRGSTGYGQAFGNAINNAYPGQDYDDLMRGVDEVVRRGYVDERNLFVTGGSGGGVLTTWIVGHTDRFAAAVAMKPVVNWYSLRRHDRRRGLVSQLQAAAVGRPGGAHAPLAHHLRRQRQDADDDSHRRPRPAHALRADRAVLPRAQDAEGADRHGAPRRRVPRLQRRLQPPPPLQPRRPNPLPPRLVRQVPEEGRRK